MQWLVYLLAKGMLCIQKKTWKTFNGAQTARVVLREINLSRNQVKRVYMKNELFFSFYRWNFPPPYGLGRNEHDGNGRFLCCPTPPVSVGECRNGIVIHTDYVNLVR